MSDALRRIDAVRRYLRRKKTLTELQTLADTLVTTDVDEVETIITSIGFGGGTSGLLRGVDRLDLLGVVEALIAEMVTAGVTSWTAAQSAANVELAVQRADFSYADLR